LHSKLSCVYVGLAVLFALISVLGVAGVVAGVCAERVLGRMETFEYIGNERCLAKIDGLEKKEPFRFAILGDIQIGTAQLPRVIQALEKEGPVSFIVMTGDAVAHADAGHYAVLLRQLAHCGLRVPMLVIPGNHDVRGDREGLFERYFGEKQFWFEYGNSLFIGLDNSLGPLTQDQYAWLETVLKEQDAQDRPSFVFLHAEPIYWEGHGKVSLEPLYARLFQLFGEYNVDYSFSGNWHGYYREERDGTVFVINGRGGDFDHDERLAPCYLTVVEVQGQKITDRCIELQPQLSVVCKSLVDDWLIAHLGRLATMNVWVTAIVSSASALCCALLVWLAIRRRPMFCTAMHQEVKDG